MKLWLAILTLLAVTAARSDAQSNAAPRLAVIVENDSARTAGDMLTAELSKRTNLQLLERTEIEKVYREQSLSAANKDYLKLGRILGADGLLLIEASAEGTNQFFNVRLVAVKPGVVLIGEKLLPPKVGLAKWWSTLAKHLDPLFPKLTVLANDAIPLSVVNLRSAVQSATAAEAERQLKLLTIQRLSQEPRLFVLERQRMQQLSEEKALNGLEDSPFWNGSYLLEGSIDQNGYSRDTITIHARLTPPKGGLPLVFEVSGSRTNFAGVINQLALKVTEALKIRSTVREWNAADEAAQFLDEAKWALKWGALPEAQATAESAWALGKKDLDCALVRLRAYLGEIPKTVPAGVQYYVNRLPDNVHYVPLDRPPDAKNIERALHVLDLYLEFSRNSPDGEPKVLTSRPAGHDWHNSDWYQLGVDSLAAASGVLLHFHSLPQAQGPVADQLAGLRRQARAVAGLISEAPTVRDSYYVGNRLATDIELNDLSRTMHDRENIFTCQVKWGYLWQERPEDGMALYRELMRSPVFCFIHQHLWIPDEERGTSSRLAAWNSEDRKRLPALWNGFVQELNGSTNLLWRLEGKALAFLAATNDQPAAAAFNSLFDLLLESRESLVANPVEVSYFVAWSGNDLMDKAHEGISSDTQNELRRRYRSQYGPALEAMYREYWDKTVPERKQQAEFEMQKRYLRENTPYDFFEFTGTFRYFTYTREQAAELKPLLLAYKSNQVERLQGRTGPQAGSMIAIVDSRLRLVEQALNPPPVAITSTGTNSTSRNPTQAIARIPPGPAGSATNIVRVNKFLKIPLENLTDYRSDGFSAPTINAHHWSEGKLLLDLQYKAFIYSFDDQGKWKSTIQSTMAAIAVFNPGTEHWEVVSCPQSELSPFNRFYHRSVLWHGDLFNNDAGTRRFNFTEHQWQTLPISLQDDGQLFSIAGHLYTANDKIIFEIIDDGKATRILASTRRYPALSALDGLESFGVPTLFEGPEHSLRACIRNKIYTWTKDNWREDFAAGTTLRPELFAEGMLFRDSARFDQPISLSHLAFDSTTPELCFVEKSPAAAYASRPPTNVARAPKPKWRIPPGYSLMRLSTAARGSEIYLLANHAEVKDTVDANNTMVKRDLVAKDGYHAELIRFQNDLPTPQNILLRFDDPAGSPPVGKMIAEVTRVPNFPVSTQPWLVFADDLVFFGIDGSQAAGHPPGIWLIPVSELESATAAQTRDQLAAKKQSFAESETVRKKLLAQYDVNHDGTIDPAERESALDNPVFLESELESIDANESGVLDVEELAWFDANTNGILESVEETGIGLTQKLIAEKTFAALDVNRDGLLDWLEFSDLTVGNGAGGATYFKERFPNQQKTFTPSEFAAALEALTTGRLLESRIRRPPAFVPGSPFREIRPTLKEAAEAYWQRMRQLSNRSAPAGARNLMLPPGPAFE